MLCTDGQANGIGVNVLILQLFCCKLRMRCRSRVNYQALNIRYIGQQGEDLQIVDKRMRLFLSALCIWKVKIDAPPLGKYFSYSTWSG